MKIKLTSVFVDDQDKALRFYKEVLGFHRFWSADDKDVSTKYNALRSIIVADPTEVIKMPINRPAAGLKKSQIEGFVEYYSDCLFSWSTGT